MMVIFTSRSTKKSLYPVRRVMDSFADRIGNDTWKTIITMEGLQTVQMLLRRIATKNTAVACHWIRSRNHSELVWIVGRRNMFNEEGNIPVHSTEKDILHSGWENDWWYLPLIKALAALAGLFHDWGKASGWFQKKLVKEKIIADLYRHEWISCKLLEAVVLATDASDDDRKWLNALANGNLKTEDIGKYLRMDEDLDESKLPPLAKWLIWLILSHHKMPMQDKELTNMWVNVERSTFQSLFAKLNAS